MARTPLTMSATTLLFLAIAHTTVAFVEPAARNYTVDIRPDITWGTWQGWGTSLAWWAAKFGPGQGEALANIFYTLIPTPWGNEVLPGLGFNIARYNLGATSRNSINGETLVESPNVLQSRLVDGYWFNWFSEDPSNTSSWNWDADPLQRAMMLAARDRGANHIELFSNSPMWWMLYNNNPSGANNGNDDNLQPWNYRQHAIYMANVAKHAKDNWGIEFETVEPFNEPMSTWWHSGGTQEGCHMAIDTQRQLLKLLREELDARGLQDMMIAASDETDYDLAIETWDSLGEDARAFIDRVNVHGYQQGSGRRDILYDRVAPTGKQLWNDEYGENDPSGNSLIRNLMLDFRWLHPTGWVYWQVLDGQGWGLIDSVVEDGTTGQAAQKYFCLAQFTRHIREGFTIIDAGLGNVIAAYSELHRRLVIVAVNWDEPQTIDFDLSRFSVVGIPGAPVKRWYTVTGTGGARYVPIPNDIYLDGKTFTATFETNMIQTFEIEGVQL